MTTNNIVLIGMMACGKTSVGKAASQQAGLAFLDTDAFIEAHMAMPIPHIFAQYGESYFRDLEAEAALHAAGQTRTVIATGGGLPLRAANTTALRASGKIVYLRCNAKELLRRTRDDENRPLLKGLGEAERLAHIQNLLAQREPLYRQHSDLVLDADEPDAEKHARAILKWVGYA